MLVEGIAGTACEPGVVRVNAYPACMSVTQSVEMFSVHCSVLCCHCDAIFNGNALRKVIKRSREQI
jgi:hypothetical protein